MTGMHRRDEDLHRQIAQIANQAGASCVAAAFYDYESETAWSLRGDRWFHAASTIKVAVLLSVFAAARQGRFTLDAPVHVRNRFLSVADGEPYRIEPGRDANAEVHAAVGKDFESARSCASYDSDEQQSGYEPVGRSCRHTSRRNGRSASLVSRG